MATLLFEMSVLHPAKEPDGRGTVFGFDLLGVSGKYEDQSPFQVVPWGTCEPARFTSGVE
jgi:hypothetical protein